jgi:hypothetical protein
MFRSNLLPAATLQVIESAGSSKMVVPVYQTIRHHITEDRKRDRHRCELLELYVGRFEGGNSSPSLPVLVVVFSAQLNYVSTLL